ncbi:MAG TPA: tyrosine-protein phosphatase [Gaiellales bacterium]|nr:tyrosine-protein phosphatase [Gaiellales bacterium]
MTRTLIWDGLENVRDLGGIPTEDGSSTRYGAFVRADNVRRLRDARTLVDYGITRVVDLRFPAELKEDVLDALPVEVTHVSLLGEWDDDYAEALKARMSATDPAEYLRWSYLDFLDRFRPNFGVALGLIAGAPPGVVCVHCVGGRDRTGLISALVLRLAGVSIGAIGRDYAESETRLAESHARWVAKAADEQERAYRLVFAQAPAIVMEQVLAALEDEHGSVRGYLLAAGAEAAALDRLRARLRA